MKSPSGNFVLRISPALHRTLRNLATKRGQSLNRLCAQVLERSAGLDVGSVANPSGGVEATLRRLVDECTRVFGEELLGVVLFGSVARGEAFPDSDLDLLLVMDRCRPIRRGLYATWDETLASCARRTSLLEVNPHFSHLPECPEEAGSLWLEITIDGVVLWEHAGEVSATLRDLRSHLAAGHAVRRFRHGHPYWVRRRPSAGVGEGA